MCHSKFQFKKIFTPFNLTLISRKSYIILAYVEPTLQSIKFYA